MERSRSAGESNGGANEPELKIGSCSRGISPSGNVIVSADQSQATPRQAKAAQAPNRYHRVLIVSHSHSSHIDSFRILFNPFPKG